MMPNRELTFWGVTAKTVVVHTLTYFLAGIVAFTLLDYETRFADPVLHGYLRSTDAPIIALGPLLQIIRGLLFGVVFYLLREPLFCKERGWLTMWLMLIIVGIFSTFGPAPGSIEGLIYTTVPAGLQLGGLGEVLAQALLLSVALFYWVRHPEKQWVTWLLTACFVLVITLSALGYFLA